MSDVVVLCPDIREMGRSKNYKINVQQAITVKDGQEYSLWESKFSLEKLRSIREEAGLIIFNMQYQNNTELAKGKIFKYKYFKHFEEYEVDYDLNRVRVKVLDSQGVPYWIPVRIYMGADLAISEDETSNNDYFVLTVIGVDKNKNVYVLDYLTHGEHRVKRSLTKNFEWCVDVGIPKIDPKFVGTCDTSLHEEMHFLDMLLSVRGEVKYPNKMFSESYKPLIGAFDKATPKIGDRAKKLFTEFSEYYQKINKKRHEKYDTMIAELDKQYYAGKIDAKKFNSTAKKIWKEIVAESDKEIRSFKGGGISGLQDIYDAISNGVFRDTGEVLYGHGSSYYQDRHRNNPNCSESLANYAALSIGHPELIEILAEDHPEIVKALRQCVEDMAKEVAKL